MWLLQLHPCFVYRQQVLLRHPSSKWRLFHDCDHSLHRYDYCSMDRSISCRCCSSYCATVVFSDVHPVRVTGFPSPDLCLWRLLMLARRAHVPEQSRDVRQSGTCVTQYATKSDLLFSWQVKLHHAHLITVKSQEQANQTDGSKTRPSEADFVKGDYIEMQLRSWSAARM